MQRQLKNSVLYKFTAILYSFPVKWILSCLCTAIILIDLFCTMKKANYRLLHSVLCQMLDSPSKKKKKEPLLLSENHTYDKLRIIIRTSVFNISVHTLDCKLFTRRRVIWLQGAMYIYIIYDSAGLINWSLHYKASCITEHQPTTVSMRSCL